MPERRDGHHAATVLCPLYLQYDDANFYWSDRKEVLLEQLESRLDKFLADIQKRALRMAEIATGNREDALDIVQEAMGKFVQKYSARQPEEWGALFHTVLQSRIRDWYRRESVRNRFRIWFGSSHDEDAPDPLDNVADAKSRSPEQELHNNRSMAVLAQAIRKLPLRQQQVVMLRIFEGMDIEQTARVMGCSGGSVKTHYSRAVHTLREQLEGYWP